LNSHPDNITCPDCKRTYHSGHIDCSCWQRHSDPDDGPCRRAAPETEAIFTITVDGPPRAKSRAVPHFVTGGGNRSIGLHTSPAQRAAEEQIKALTALQMRRQRIPEGQRDVIADVEVVAHFPVPGGGSTTTTEALLRQGRRARRPDGDNIAKTVKDALNGIAYHDDGQVSDLIVRKRWCPRGDERLVVTVRYHDGVV